MSPRQKMPVYRDHDHVRTESQSRSMQLFITLASIGDAVITTDSSGDITFLNPVAEELTGWSLEEAVGLDVEGVFRVVNEPTGITIPNVVRTAIETTSKISLPTDTVLVKKDGSQIPVDDSAAPIVDMDGNVLGAVLVFRDITQSKQAEQLIKRRSEMDRMAARISTAFITSPVSEVDNQIRAALKDVGEFYHADRSYVYLYSRDGATMSCTHQWCADGVECTLPETQNIPVSVSPVWTEIIRSRRHVHVTGPEDIPQWAGAERELWEQRNVQTFITVPMSLESRVLGYVGLDSIQRAKPWPEEAIDLLYLIGNVFANAMERRDSVSKLEAAREQEVEIGSRIQQALLIGQPPAAFADYQVAALTIPSRKIDGDFYDFLLHPNHCLDIIFGDVMGKGVPAALLAAGSKTEFQRSLSQLLASSRRGVIPQPQDIVNSVHKVLTPQLMALESFVTLSYVRFDPGRKLVILVDCGNTRILRCEASNGNIEQLTGENIPLGFIASEEYTQAEYPYDEDDIFILYSDGATEARNPEGEMFGLPRLCDVIAQNRHLSPNQIVEALREVVTNFVGTSVLTDDFTCVVVKVCQEMRAPLQKTEEILVTSNLNELATIRDFLKDFCERRRLCQVDEKEYHLLELAITEVASNIMRHSYEGKEDQPIWVYATLVADELKVRFLHKGKPFRAPDRVMHPPFDASREGGYGLFIIDRSVDDINYGVDEEGRHYIELIKKIKSPNP